MCLVEFGTPALGPDRKPISNPDGAPKIAKSPRPAIACATPISPGMEIYTNTPNVKQMREGVLEFLLINHPLDCPICDQAGECKLQEYSVEYGRSESRFVETKVHKPKRVDLGPRIVLDDERCILCTRCIRFTKDLVGDDALGIVNRGSYNTLTAYPFLTTIPAPNQTNGHITTYYRTHFNWDGSLTNVNLISTNYVDDGTV